MNRPSALLASFLLAFASTACVASSEQTSSDELQDQRVNRFLFEPTSILALRIDAPLATLFAREEPDPGHTILEEDPPFTEGAIVRIGTRSIRARIEKRGFSSAEACPFPKLKLFDFDPAQARGTLLEGRKSIRINTHCGLNAPTVEEPRFQRDLLGNHRAPLREYLAYQILHAIGQSTVATRLGMIDYRDTSVASPLPSGKHLALLLESDGDFRRRLTEENRAFQDADFIDADRLSSTDAALVFDRLDGSSRASTILANWLLGNADFKVEREAFWNVLALDVEGGAVHLFPYDFDRSILVRGTASELSSAAWERLRETWKDTLSSLPSSIAEPSAQRERALQAIDAVQSVVQRNRSTRGLATDRGFEASYSLVNAFYDFWENHAPADTE